MLFLPKGSFTDSCGAKGGLGPTAGIQMCSGLQALTTGIADGGHGHRLWSLAGRFDPTHMSENSSEVPHQSPLRFLHTWSSTKQASQSTHHWARLFPDFPVFNITQAPLNHGSPASGGHPHRSPHPQSLTYTWSYFLILISCHPSLLALAVPDGPSTLSPPFIFSPFPILLYQGAVAHIVNLAGPRSPSGRASRVSR